MLWREKLLENGDCGERRIVPVAASSVDKSSESSHLETKGFHPGQPGRAEGRCGPAGRWANNPAAATESDQHPTRNGRVGWRRSSEGNGQL